MAASVGTASRTDAMNSCTQAAAAPPPQALWIWGRTALVSALGLGLLATLAVASLGSWPASVLLPAAMVVLAAAFWLFRHPATNLFVVLVGFVIVADNEAGFQLREVLYALYLYSVLALWYFDRLLIRRKPLLRTRADQALGLFLLLLPFTMVLTVIFNGRLVGALSELFSLSLLALYFPLKETAARYRWAPRALVLTVVSVGMLVALRNCFEYWQMLGRVTQAWQVETGRVVTNDSLLMVSSLFGLTLMVYANRWKVLIASGACFLLCFAGLILTQSRGYWMAFSLGAMALFALADNRRRVRMLLVGGAGLAAMISVGYVLVGSYMGLLLGGLGERILSIGTAFTADLSLINRFREAASVMELVKENPVLGYGMGVSYYFYDIAHQLTDYDALVHNGYVGLWYKFGIWGAGLMLFFWGNTLWHGIQAARARACTPWTRICGLAAAVSLTGFALSTITSNPFFLKDSLFIFSVTAGLSGGAYLRFRREHAEAPAT